MRTGSLLKLVAVATATFTSHPALAANFSCRALPTSYLGMNASGWVVVGVDGVGQLQVCNVQTQVGSVAPAACVGWYSTMLTWRSTGKFGWLYFDGGNSANSGATSCANFSAWDIRYPYHLEAG